MVLEKYGKVDNFRTLTKPVEFLSVFRLSGENKNRIRYTRSF